MIRKPCNYKIIFVKLCESRNKRPTLNAVNNSVRIENFAYVPPDVSCIKHQESFGFINALNENGHSDNDNCFVLRLITLYG